MQFALTLGHRGADSGLGFFDGILLFYLAAILLNVLGVSTCDCWPMLFGPSEHISLDALNNFHPA